MRTATQRFIVVGAGALGVSSALELRQRGHDVVLVDPGPVPHPRAASTDISKLIRADYGSDAHYVELMELAHAEWLAMNQRLARPLFHETGVVVLATAPMQPGEFEHDSFALLSARGYPLERLDARAIRERFPAFSGSAYRDGYFNGVGGWAESGEVVRALHAAALRAGVTMAPPRRVTALLDRPGIACDDGTTLAADHVVVTTGAWVTQLLPELADRLAPVAQPVFVLAPDDAAPFRPPQFVPFAAEIAKTGWYGFCANAEGLVKIANHGPGIAIDPDGGRQVPSVYEAELRAFLADSLPSLAGARIVRSHLCLYADSFDGDFLIARAQGRAGVTVATGDSGHAFKFTPVLGQLVADAALGVPNRFSSRFAWRERTAARHEAARYIG